METIGKFEFNRKDLIGHGAFAVVFKGRHKWKHDLEVAVKCINKKNWAKSQSLLGKEIQILKELKHENIVGLLDFQEMGGCVYLVMEYCNGGDLAEYLNSKGTLSEDTIRVFLQQIAGAMKVLQGKGILHRDLKPQNILLCHPEGRKSSPNNTCIKIADFGFARHLQTNTMAATLCGSPMYMAPEVIMSQNYDAKADLWSIGTILYQCLTGKAPFQASTPQELRLFYEVNRSLLPSVPRETSSQLRHLLLGLLQRNHRDRMDFDEFFHHPFLESSSSAKKSSPVPIPSYPSSGSGSSCSSSSTSHMASPQHSDAEMQRLQAKAQPSPLKDATIHNSRNTSSDTEDFVIVPAEFPSDITCEIGDGSPIQGSMLYSGSSLLVAAGGLENLGRTPPPSPSPRCPPNPVRPAEFSGSNYSQSVPIPVPTQIHNYQRMEQKLHPAGLHGSTRATLCCVGSGGSGGSPGCKKTGFSPPHPSSPGAAFSSHRLSAGGARPYQPSPQVGTIPETPEQTGPLSTRTEQLAGCPGMEHTPTCPQMIQRRKLDFTPPGSQSPQAMPPFEFPQPPSSQNLGPTRTRTMPDLKVLGLLPGTQPNIINRAAGKRKGSFKRSLSAGRLSDILLKAAFGAQLLDGGSNESLNTEKPMDTTAPPGGALRVAGGSASPTAVFFTVGSPSSRNTPPYTTHNRMSSAEGSPSSAWSYCGRLVPRGVQKESDSTHKQQLTDPPAALPDGTVAFDPPEFPEETLMEQGHMDALSNLRFTLAFAHCIMEIACSKDTGFEANDAPDVSFLQQSLVADQISLLSREWSYAEQLVLYMKAAEFLSSTLHAAIEGIRQGRLSPTPTVKQVVRKMNELYKSSVTSCRSLNARLHNFLLNKQRLMDQINSMTAEKLLYSHTVNMVQSAALDEMFHQGQASIQSYHKALLLMEGLSLIITEQADIDNISKCKQWIERRLQTVQST